MVFEIKNTSNSFNFFYDAAIESLPVCGSVEQQTKENFANRAGQRRLRTCAFASPHLDSSSLRSKALELKKKYEAMPVKNDLWTMIDSGKSEKGEYYLSGGSIIIESKGFSEREILELLYLHPKSENVSFLNIKCIDGSDPVGEETLQYLSDHFQNINHLNIFGFKVDNRKISNLNLSFPRLDILHLGLVGDEPLDSGAENWARSMPNLTDWRSLYGAITDAAIDSLFRSCPRIEHFSHTALYNLEPRLRAKYFSTLTDQGLASISEHGKNLSFLQINRQMFTEPGILDFMENISRRNGHLALCILENQINIPGERLEEFILRGAGRGKICIDFSSIFSPRIGIPYVEPYHGDDDD